MHLVWVIRRFYPLLLGGTEIRMKQVAEVLIPRGYKVTVLTRRLEANLAAHENVSGIEIHRFPPADLLFQLGVKKWVKDNHRSIDLIHTFRFDKLGMVGAWCQRQYRIPHVADIITNEFKNMLQNKKRKVEKIIKGAALIHCLNQHTVNLLKQVGAPDSKIWYRPNAVDTDLFYPADSVEPEEKVTFLFCGRFDNQKGVDFLIASWKRVPRDLRAKARLVLVGSGEREGEFRQLATGEPEIIFAGQVEREAMPDCYRQAQVYIQPSKFEGMSNAILEALASGLPVITTKVEGNADLVTPGYNGLLVAYGDIDGLANAVITLLQEPELRRQMGLNSRKLAETRYSMSALFDDYQRMYDLIREMNDSCGENMPERIHS
ncbi:MAG TPA: glycosyltransferase family 4 protein [Firmicutes bacterium]|nr:glycosyltransferase family 4 protein [Bacillota bacterium]